MTFRVKLPYLISTILLVIILPNLLSKNTPFAGDEFYSRDVEKIYKLVHYWVVVSQIIGIINTNRPRDIFSFSFISILFTLIRICN